MNKLLTPLAIALILTTILATATPQTAKAKTYTQPPPPKKLWESKSLGGWVLGVAWSPDGQKLAAGTRGGRVFVFSSTGKLLWKSKELGGDVLGVAWSPDGQKLAAGTWEKSRRVFVFSSTGKLLWESQDLGGGVYGVAWSPDGQKLAAGTRGGRVFVFSSTGKLLWKSKELGGDVLGVAWSPDGQKLAARTRGGRVVVYSITGHYGVIKLYNTTSEFKVCLDDGSVVDCYNLKGSGLEVYADPGEYVIEVYPSLIVGELGGYWVEVPLRVGGGDELTLDIGSTVLSNLGVLRVSGPAGCVVTVSWGSGSREFIIPDSGVLELLCVPGAEYTVYAVAPGPLHSPFSSVVSVPSAGSVASVSVSFPFSTLFYVVLLGVVGGFGTSFYAAAIRPRVSVRLLTKEVVEGVTEYIQVEFRNSGLMSTSFRASIEVNGTEVFSGVIELPGRSRRVVRVRISPNTPRGGENA